MILTPKNWNSFQHYKDRSPAWIKLHRGLLDDFEFCCLPVASRALAPFLWLLASEYEDGKIVTTLDELAFRFRMTRGDVAEALSPLVQGGFFDASEPLANGEQPACLEKEDIGKKEKEKIAAPKAAEPKPEKKSRSKPKVVVSDDFKFSHAVRQYAALLGFSESEIARELQRFIRHAKQNDRRCADWDAAAHNWFDKAAEFAGKAPPRSGPAADDGMIEVLNEDQLVAWDRYATSRGAKTFPRNSRGGWRFPSRWPPGYSPPEESRDDPMPALTLQSMQ